MSDRKLPKIEEVFAHQEGKTVKIAFHGADCTDDRRGELTPMQALRLAEMLTRAARDALSS